MPNSAPPPPPLTPSPKRLLSTPKPKQTPLHQNSALIHLPQNDKKTRDLPNLSDCHGCGIRIDYSNPKQRLKPLDSFWRIVLLCKKCSKQVISGQICLYCFNGIANPSFDCFDCPDCDRIIHKDCLSKFGSSAPWSYCSRESGLGFSVCIDCWVPKLMKKSIRVRKKKNENGDSGSSGRIQSGDRSLEEMVKDPHCSVEKTVAMAVKAKEKALKKAVVAKNAVELANNALDLAVKKDGNGKTISDGFSDVTRAVDDAELAFQLHRAMNSSPRISKNTCSLNFSCVDVLQKTGSDDISKKWMDSGSLEGGKAGVCSKSELNECQERSISEPKEGGSALVSGRLTPVLKNTYSRHSWKRNDCSKISEVGDTVSVGVVNPVLMTYRRNNLKRKERLENVEIDDVVTSAVVKPDLRTYTRKILKTKECLGNSGAGDVGTCTIKDDTRIESEFQCCLQDEDEMDLPIDSIGKFSPEQASDDIIGQEGRVNPRPEQCSGNSEVGDVGTCIVKDDRIVSESQCFLQDEDKMELPVDSCGNFSPDKANGDIIWQERIANPRPEHSLLDYSSRIGGSSEGIQTDACSYYIAFDKENQASASRPGFCSAECSGLSDASLHSCVVNLQGCASVVGSSQEGI